MRIAIEKFGDDLFVEGSWISTFGSHARRLTEELPEDVRSAVDTLMTWANDKCEPELRKELTKIETAQEIGREMAKLNERLKQVQG